MSEILNLHNFIKVIINNNNNELFYHFSVIYTENLKFDYLCVGIGFIIICFFLYVHTCIYPILNFLSLNLSDSKFLQIGTLEKILL